MVPDLPDLAYASLALQDLVNIGAHLEHEASSTVAARTIRQILNYCETLRALPFRNPSVEYADEPMRVGLHGPYRIFYVVSANIEIARIIHQSRDVSAETFSDGRH